MSSLSLLVSSLIPPHLTEALLTELQAEKLITAQDLLFSQSALSDNLSDFKDKVLIFLASEGKAGDVAYNEAKQARSEANAGTRVSTTFPEIDNKLLDGGFRAGDIVELLGDSAADSGNTYASTLHSVQRLVLKLSSQLCLSATLNHLKRHSTSFALWLDTAGTFSAEKAIQVLRCLPNEAEERDLSDEQAVSILDRLIVAHAPDLASAAQAIQKARRADFDVGAMPKPEEDREASTEPAPEVLAAAEPDDNDVEGPSDSANASQQNNGIRMPAREQSIVSFMAASQMSQSQSRRSSSRVMPQQRETETSVNNQPQESPAAVVDTQEADETKNDPRGDAEPTASSSHPQLAIVVLDPITPLVKGILSGVTAEGALPLPPKVTLLTYFSSQATPE